MDYTNLIIFIITKELERRQIKRIELLEEYKFKIKYIFRKEYRIADTLSRRLDYIEGKEIINTPILRKIKDRALVYIKHLVVIIYITRLGIQKLLKNDYKKDQLIKKLPKENGVRKY